jgi:hypothetical protein
VNIPQNVGPNENQREEVISYLSPFGRDIEVEKEREY